MSRVVQGEVRNRPETENGLKVCSGWCDQTSATLHGAVWCCILTIKCLTHEGLSEADLAPRKKDGPLFPQGMSLFICPPIGLPEKVSVKAQLHVGL